MTNEQQTVLYEGRVQGVGFRYTACRVAGGHGVTGYVRNLPDGRVECVAEGDSSEIAAFWADLEQTMGGYIRGHTKHSAPACGGFTDFGVRY